MRLQGKVVEWNDERGFGFVVQNGASSRTFLHISAFRGNQGRRPLVGCLITYEILKDDKGRHQAIDVQFVDRARARAPSSRVGAGSLVVGLVLLLMAGYLGYVRFWKPGSAVSLSSDEVISAGGTVTQHPEFHCSPQKNSCSKMTSCAEAQFHQDKCGVVGMDGDDDGIPCERQWCN